MIAPAGLFPNHFSAMSRSLFHSFSKIVLPGALATLLLLLAVPARGQLQVELKLSRRSFIMYESLIATVTVTNNAGRDLELQDDQGTQWFNLEVTKMSGETLIPYNPDYKLRPLMLPAGQSLARKIDVTPLFPIRELGTHRLRANIYFADTGRYYASNFVSFEMTEGKLLWRQTVGVPGTTNEMRQVSLLTHQLTDRMLLYVRVRDEDGDAVYTTQSLGRLIITGREPQEFFDRGNTLHVLQEAVPGTYLYTAVNLNGERIDQKAYVRSGSSRPILVKSATGEVSVRGGQVQAAPAGGVRPAGTDGGAKLSDRPAGLPVPPRQ